MTSIVLEIPFISDNTYDTKITLSMLNCPSYATAFLYCSENKLPNPYQTLHGTYTVLAGHGVSSYYNSTNMAAYTAGDNLADVSNSGSGLTISAGDGNIHYAYILVDYVAGLSAGTYPSTTGDSPQIYFRLTANQV